MPDTTKKFKRKKSSTAKKVLKGSIRAKKSKNSRRSGSLKLSRPKTLLRIFSYSFSILIVFALFILIWMGFVPGISAIAGATTPKDLGIEYSGADKANARMKSGMRYDSLPAATQISKSIQRNGSIELKDSFSSAELTALLNDRPYRYWPLEDVQLRINNDSSVEMSGRIIMANLPAFAEAEKIPGSITDRLIDMAPTEPVFYIKGKAGIKDGKIDSLKVNRFQIGRVMIPMYFLHSVSETDLSKSHITRPSEVKTVEEWLAHFVGFGAREASFRDGRLFFDGTISAEELTVR